MTKYEELIGWVRGEIYRASGAPRMSASMDPLVGIIEGKVDAAIAEAVAAERERCVRILETWGVDVPLLT